MSNVVVYERRGDVAVIRLQNPPVNALSHSVRTGLLVALDQAETDGGVKSVLLVGTGRAFIAGADIKEFGKKPLTPHLPDICNRIEASPLVVVASIHGVCLGGGLEVALGAHYRTAQPDARVGLPEVHLGLLPGAGGTQRLPRIAGVDAALDMITSGRHVAAPEALEMGVIDQIAAGDPETTGLAYANALLAQGAVPRPVREIPPPPAVDWNATYAAVLQKGRGQISPAQAVRAVQASVELPFFEGLAAERRMFRDLMETDQRQGMIHAFFSQRAVGNLPELKDIAPRTIETVAVVGGGTMGAGIATAALLSGLHVIVLERDAKAAGQARNRVAGNIAGALKRGKIDIDTHDKILNDALVVATEFRDLAAADLVIEAVFEDIEVKKSVFLQLDAVCKQNAVLATNTSYLDINEIAAATSRPGDVIGLHFFSPAHVMKLLEVVVAAQTAPDVAATGFALGKRLGKIAVRSGVCDGFIGNRILRANRTVADHMTLDGATPFQIDKALTDFGFAMGPFAVSDLAGLDIGWAMRKRLSATLDPRERVGRYADKLCEAGHFGRKAGTGFYIYTQGATEGVPNPDVMALVEAERAERDITPRAFTEAQIVRRYLAAMVNEAARVLDEGIARRPLDVDMVLLHGYGFPRFWGGPLKWADLVGLPELLADIERYAQADDFFWRPASLLTELVSEGRCFADLNTSS